MQEKWKRLTKLVRETGDRLVVTDSESEEVYVLMSFDQYEALTDSAEALDRQTPEQVLQQQTPTEGFEETPFAKNEDGEVIRVRQEEEPPEEIWDVLQDGRNEPEDGNAKAETWDVSQLNESEKAFLKDQYRKFKQGEPVYIEEGESSPQPTPQTPGTVSQGKVEPVESEESDDDFTEEQFYLEPID